jgi:putative peptidoglycan lipid II flippase
VGADSDFQIRLADNQGAALSDYSKAATSPGASGRTVVTLDKPTQARYVLIWLTKLPSVSGGYRGQISEVVIRGT